MAAVYCYEDIVEALKRLGITKGDSLFIHSNLGFFGRLKDCDSSEKLCETFYQAIKEVIGLEGTLTLPAFSYSFCHGEVFDKNLTKTGCGLFPEYMRRRANAVRSDDPNFSIVASGKNAVFYTENPVHESFGKGSFWEKFLHTNGKILCMNFDCGSTFVHYVEHENRVPYRYNKAFNGEMICQGKKIKDYFVHYVYDKDKPKDEPSFVRLDQLCKENGISKTVFLARGAINCMESQAYFHFISEMLKKEPYFLTKGGSNEKN